MKAFLTTATYLFLCYAPWLAAQDWPQWRGPTRDGQWNGARWPDHIDARHLQERWRVELGPSYSGPIVCGDYVFTTETKDKQSEVVTAYERGSGRQTWRTQWEGAVSVPFFAKSNGDWIRSTPACDGTNLFVAGMRDVLVCLNAQTGELRWRVDFVKQWDTPVPEFGFVCSPLLEGNAVYVQAGASVVKLDKATGQILWRSLQDQGGMWGSVFSSPLIATLGGQRQLLVQTREKLAGLSLDEGTVLWEQPVQAFRGMNILTPMVHEDIVFTSSYGGKTIGFRVTATNGGFTVTPAWSHKSQGYMSTPVIIEGIAYHHLKSQRVMAIEVQTGRELWTSDQSFGKYWSLVAQADRLLALDQRGQLYLLRANPEKFDLLDQRKIAGSDTWAHLALAGDELFVRELDALVAYQWQSDPATVPAP